MSNVDELDHPLANEAVGNPLDFGLSVFKVPPWGHSSIRVFARSSRLYGPDDHGRHLYCFQSPEVLQVTKMLIEQNVSGAAACTAGGHESPGL
jgi:hypothetical protein